MRSFFRVFSVVLLILWMCTIFFFSSQTADASSQTSGQLIEVLAEKFYPNFEDLSETQQQEAVESLQFYVRKAAHAAEFAILGFLAFLTFISYVNLRFFTRCFWAFAVSAIYAASDEFHQRFVVGRSCELRDFLIDASAVFVAILLTALFVKIIAPLRRKTAFAGVNKKSLVKLNTELYEQLDNSYFEQTNLKAEISNYKERIESLELELSQQKITEIQTFDCVDEGQQIMETKIEKEPVQFSDEMQYASSIIGKTVVEVTKLCNQLTKDEQDITRKELVNLALGRTEVLKSEILKILGMEISFEEKKNFIEKEQQQALDYFDSIKAQIC